MLYFFFFLSFLLWWGSVFAFLDLWNLTVALSQWMSWTAGGSNCALNSRRTCRKGLWGLFFFILFLFLLLIETQEQMKAFSQSKRRNPSAVDLPWQWILKALEELSGSSGWASLQLLPLHHHPGKDVHLNWAGGLAAEKRQREEGCRTGHCLPRVSLTLSPSLSSANCYLFATVFCSLILSSGSFQPRENSLQVPVLNPLTTVTLSVFSKPQESQRICWKAYRLQISVSCLIWRESDIP